MNALSQLFHKYFHEISWALLFCAVQLAWLAGEKVTGLHDIHIDKQESYTNLMAIPSILIFLFAMIQKKKALKGDMSFKQGFMSGLGITMIVTGLTPIVQYITHTIITPDYFTNVKAYAIAQGMNKEVAHQHFTLNSYITISVFVGFVYGVVTTSITSFVTKFIKVS